MFYVHHTRALNIIGGALKMSWVQQATTTKIQSKFQGMKWKTMIYFLDSFCKCRMDFGAMVSKRSLLTKTEVAYMLINEQVPWNTSIALGTCQPINLHRGL